jgi:hypothetical protein
MFHGSLDGWQRLLARTVGGRPADPTSYDGEWDHGHFRPGDVKMP